MHSGLYWVTEAWQGVPAHSVGLLGDGGKDGGTMHGRYEQVEEAKRAMRKKQELEKRFNNGEGAGSSSGEEEDDGDLEDEDKITEQEEAGAPLPPSPLHLNFWEHKLAHVLTMARTTMPLE